MHIYPLFLIAHDRALSTQIKYCHERVIATALQVTSASGLSSRDSWLKDIIVFGTRALVLISRRVASTTYCQLSATFIG